MICIPVSSDRDLRWARHGSGHSERLRYHGSMNEGPRLRSIVGRTKAARRLEDYPATEAPPSAKAQRQLSADLFRDDTFLRAVILNGILVLISGAALLDLLNS